MEGAIGSFWRETFNCSPEFSVHKREREREWIIHWKNNSILQLTCNIDACSCTSYESLLINKHWDICQSMPLPVHLNSHFSTIVSTPNQFGVTKTWREDTKVVANRWIITVSWIETNEHWWLGVNSSNWISLQRDITIARSQSNGEEFQESAIYCGK